MSKCKGCGFTNCDLEILGCGCTFHARCFPLCKSTPFQPCPGCTVNKKPKLFILPALTQTSTNSTITATDTSTVSKKPRSGRWTIHEITVVDEICRLFELGMLPLPTATKLSEFLSQFLGCKSSRLTKKLRMGNLSQLYVRQQGYISVPQVAYEFSTILAAFFSFYPDLQVKSESVWRENFFNICLEFCVPVVNASEFCESLDRKPTLTSALRTTKNKVRSISIASSSLVPSVTDSVKEDNNIPNGQGQILLTTVSAPTPVVSLSNKHQDDEYFEGLDAFLQDLDDVEPSASRAMKSSDVTTEEETEMSEEDVSVAGGNVTQIMHYQHSTSPSDNDNNNVKMSESKTCEKIITSPAQSLCNILALHMPVHTSTDDNLSTGYTLLRLALLRHFNGFANRFSPKEEEVLQVVLSSYDGYCSINGGNIGKDIAKLIVQEYLMLLSQVTPKRRTCDDLESGRKNKHLRSSSISQTPQPALFQRSVSHSDNSSISNLDENNDATQRGLISFVEQSP